MAGPLLVAQQLRDTQEALRRTQERLRESEERRAVLEEENRQLRTALHSSAGGDHAQEKTEDDDDASGYSRTPREKAKIKEEEVAASSGGSHPEQVTVPNLELRKAEIESHQKLVKELQQQISTLTDRNGMLEKEVSEQCVLLRRQYDAHIDKVELELRKLKAASTYSSATACVRPGGNNSAVSQSPQQPRLVNENSGSPVAADNVLYSTVNVPITGKTAFSPSNTGRTPESRKNLL